RERREEVRLLQDTLSNYKHLTEHWEAKYCELLAGLMAVSKQALAGKDRARSRYAAEVRENLDRVLVENPVLASQLIEINPATERWERKLRKGEEKAS
ncbi:MAG: hypothetical protein AAB780_01760, partial [Patescibacteria group bacterium]